MADAKLPPNLRYLVAGRLVLSAATTWMYAEADVRKDKSAGVVLV